MEIMVVFSNKPFVYGLPGSEVFLNNLRNHVWLYELISGFVAVNEHVNEDVFCAEATAADFMH